MGHRTFQSTRRLVMASEARHLLSFPEYKPTLECGSINLLPMSCGYHASYGFIICTCFIWVGDMTTMALPVLF